MGEHWTSWWGHLTIDTFTFSQKGPFFCTCVPLYFFPHGMLLAGPWSVGSSVIVEVLSLAISQLLL